jgi:hypothetical protein
MSLSIPSPSSSSQPYPLSPSSTPTNPLSSTSPLSSFSLSPLPGWKRSFCQQLHLKKILQQNSVDFLFDYINKHQQRIEQQNIKISNLHQEKIRQNERIEQLLAIQTQLQIQIHKISTSQNNNNIDNSNTLTSSVIKDGNNNICNNINSPQKVNSILSSLSLSPSSLSIDPLDSLSNPLLKVIIELEEKNKKLNDELTNSFRNISENAHLIIRLKENSEKDENIIMEKDKELVQIVKLIV